MKNLSELLAAIRQPGQDRETVLIVEDDCLFCGVDLRESAVYHRFRVCHACRFHYTIGARERIATLVDPDSFHERHRSVISIDPIAFGTYRKRLLEEERRTGMADAIVTGTAKIEGQDVVLAVIDFRFLGGTIGSVVGEKLTRTMEQAARKGHPLIVVVASGGARLQEGPLALMQMPKIAMARERLARARTPFLCVLTNPTLGAAYDGIGALADYAVGEPGAVIGYAAGRSTEPGEDLTAERLLAHGLLDEVVDRQQLRELLAGVITVLTARTRVRAEDTAEARRPAHVQQRAWNHVQLARHHDRPAALDYIGRMASTFVELRGDRLGEDSPLVTCGVGVIAGEAVVIIGQQRGPDVTGAKTPGAWLNPAGFRKAQRAARLAARFSLPIITLIDTPGADPRPAATLLGLGPAMAGCAAAIAEAPAPVIAAVIGQGGSEAAVAFGIADRVLMLEHAIYSVISPERAALLLHRDASRADEVADALHLTAAACRDLRVVDVIVPEPPDGAHMDHDATARELRAALLRALADTQDVPPRKLLDARNQRARAIGAYDNYVGMVLAHEASEIGGALARKAGAAASRIRHPRARREPNPQPLP